MERWCNKVAVVTGASSGIGEAIAESLVKHGMKVIGFDKHEKELKDVEKNLEGLKGTFITVKCDITKDDEVDNSFNWIDKTYGGIHVLVNNAGYTNVEKLEDQSKHVWKEIYDVNVIALQLCSQKAIRSMKLHNINDGHIINISSVLAHVSSPVPKMATYFASKKAVNAISEGFRIELSGENSDIRVTTISPGLVNTEILRKSGMNLPKNILDITLQSSDIAECVVFVLKMPRYAMVTELVIQTVRNIREAVSNAAANVENNE